MAKRSKLVPLVTMAAAYGIYSVVRGKGPFNKMHFKEQHDAVARYVDSHYAGAHYRPIEQTSKGWVTVVTKSDFSKIMLYISKAENGVYVFREVSAPGK